MNSFLTILFMGSFLATISSVKCQPGYGTSCLNPYSLTTELCASNFYCLNTNDGGFTCQCSVGQQYDSQSNACQATYYSSCSSTTDCISGLSCITKDNVCECPTGAVYAGNNKCTGAYLYSPCDQIGCTSSLSCIDSRCNCAQGMTYLGRNVCKGNMGYSPCTQNSCVLSLTCDESSTCSCPLDKVSSTMNFNEGSIDVCCGNSDENIMSNSYVSETSTGTCIPLFGFPCDDSLYSGLCSTGGLVCNSTSSTCTCAVGTAWSTAQQSCVPALGYNCNINKPCGSPSLQCSESDSVCKCAKGTTWDSTTATCTCPQYTTWDADTGSCICSSPTCCPKYTTWDSGKGTCICALNANGDAVAGTCNCIQNTQWNTNSESCACVMGTTWSSVYKKCTKIPCRSSPNSCTHGTTCENNVCMCPVDYVSDPVSLSCVVDT